MDPVTSNLFALSLLVWLVAEGTRLVETAGDVSEFLRRVIFKLSRSVEADEGWVVVSVGNVLRGAKYRRLGAGPGEVEVRDLTPEELAAVQLTPADIGLRDHLRAPIMVDSDVKGFLEFRIKQGGGQFFAPHKQLVDTAAAVLGLLFQRSFLAELGESLTARKDSLAGARLDDWRRDAMLREICRATQGASRDDIAGLAESMSQVVNHGIRSAGALVRIWKSGTERVTAAQCIEADVLDKLEAIVAASEDEVLTRPAATYKYYRRPPDRETMAPVATALMCPILRLQGHEGLVALVRKQDDPEAQFTSVEADALQVACNLVSFPAS